MNEQDPENDLLNLEDDVWPNEPRPSDNPPVAPSPRYEDIWLDDPMGADYPFVHNDAPASRDSRPVDATDEILISQDHRPERLEATEPPTADAQLSVDQPSGYGEGWLNEPPPADYHYVPAEQDSTSENPWLDEVPPFEPPFVPVAYIPETTDETARQSGLAWSAGIVFFGSVAFMLFLGWIADLVLGTAPWGIVGGVILGSIIGFVQFFRITSQIFNSKKAESAMRPLMPRDDEEQ